jgi:hypothetical protein
VLRAAKHLLLIIENKQSRSFAEFTLSEAKGSDEIGGRLFRSLVRFGWIPDVLPSGRGRWRVEPESAGDSVPGQDPVCRLYMYG